MATLAILIAKSGIALLDLLPREWEVVIADYSRLDERKVVFWDYPRERRYNEIIIVDRNITTALTQRKLEQAVHELGVEGPVRYAGNAETRLAYLHQDYVLGSEGLFAKTRTDLAGDPYRISKHMIALVGLPASGKTLLRHIFSRISGFSAYKWGKFLRATVEERFGEMTYENGWEMALRFTDEVESQDRLAVAKKFLESSGIREDAASFMVVDGIKSREQLIYVSYALKRPVVIVKVYRDETERQAEAQKRGDFDDVNDGERLKILRRMGAIDIMDFADFGVETTGGNIEYDDAAKSCRIVLTERFIAGMHDVLSWLYVSGSPEETRKLVCNSAVEVAQTRGYAATAEVI